MAVPDYARSRVSIVRRQVKFAVQQKTHTVRRASDAVVSRLDRLLAQPRPAECAGRGDKP